MMPDAVGIHAGAWVVAALIDISGVTQILGWVIYLLLALIALWGAFCVAMVWMRVSRHRFSSEEAQSEFLEQVDGALARSDFDAAAELCAADPRATPQLMLLALNNRHAGYSRVRQLVTDHFQRDVLADLEHRLSWINTVIKSAPMLGLFGTVVGMMGAFSKLAGEQTVNPENLAGDISLALVTTACGLAIAIPMVLCTASINVRIRKLEDLVAAGLTRFLDSFRVALASTSRPPISLQARAE
jgi:biopolymer transport protein ExbB/TolQ